MRQKLWCMNKFTVSESHSRGGLLYNCRMESERGGRVVASFDSHRPRTLTVLFMAPFSWWCYNVPASFPQTSNSAFFNVAIWNFLSFFPPFALFALLILFFLLPQESRCLILTRWLSHLFITRCFVFISGLNIPSIQYVFNQTPWGDSRSEHYCLVRQGVWASVNPAAGKINIFIILFIFFHFLWTFLNQSFLTLVQQNQKGDPYFYYFF